MNVSKSALLSFAISLSIVGAVVSLDPGRAHGACIDYGGYLRWEGGVSVDGGEASSAIAVAGSLACVLDANRLFLVDVSDPLHPIEKGTLALPGVGAGVAIYGETAFVAADTAGLVVVDTHDRTLPTIVATLPLPRPAVSVAVSGVDVFVAANASPSGLYVFDISTPASPRLIGSLDTPGESEFVSAVGNRAYIAAGTTGLHLIDISTPSRPVLLGTVDTPGQAVGVAVSGTIAYVADYSQGLQIVDISNPASPRISSTVPLPGIANAAVVSGTDVFVACGSPALVDVDLSEPTFPRVGGSTGTVGYAWGIAVSGHHAYIAAGSRLLQIANIENPHNPDPIGSTTLTNSVYDLAVVGSDVFLAEGASDVEIVRASQPRSPSHAGTLTTPGPAISVTGGGEDRLYVGVEGAGVLVADLTIPEAPVILGQTHGPLNPRAMALSGNTLLVAAAGDGLCLIDVSNGSAPAIITFVPTPLQAVGVAVLGGRYACVTDILSGLLIIDFLDPHAPSIVGQYSTGSAIDVAVNDQTAFVADASGLQILDVTDPTSPILQSRVELEGRPWKVTTIGTTVYIAGEDNGLQIVDAQIPTKPNLHGGEILPRARSLRPTDAGVFVGTWSSSLWIMPTQCAMVPVYFPDLSAEAEGEGMRVRWDIGSDLLFDGFVVERADDDVSFVPLNANDPVPGRGPFEYLDRTAVAGAAYSYRVAGLAPGGDRILSGRIHVVFEPERAFVLFPAAPNPSRGGAALRYELDRSGTVRLSLFDVAGRRVRTLTDAAMPAGSHRLDWDGLDQAGRRVAGGVYWIRLEAEGRRATEQITVVP